MTVYENKVEEALSESDALVYIRVAMPKNCVWIGTTYDFSTKSEEPTLSIMGNYALGCTLYVEVAKRIGRMPERMGNSTGHVAPLAAMAAGLPVPEDQWYDGHTFVGMEEIEALAEVFKSGEVRAAKTESGRTVGLA